MSATTPEVDLRNRLALSIAEAAQVMGLSENAFRNVLPGIERVYVGRRVLIPVRALEAWLDEEGHRDDKRDDELVNEMLQAVR